MIDDIWYTCTGDKSPQQVRWRHQRSRIYKTHIKYKKLSIILQRRGYTASRMVSLSLSRENASRDMSHDLLYGSSRDLDLRSNFQFDLSRSKSTCFDASWREKHDGGVRNPQSFLVQMLFAKKTILAKNAFLNLLGLTWRGQYVTLRGQVGYR